MREEELSAHAYFEEFQEKLAAGMLQAEPLDQVISQAVAEEQDRKKPDPPRQYGIHLDVVLTIQTRHEELRQKYDVLFPIVGSTVSKGNPAERSTRTLT